MEYEQLNCAVLSFSGKKTVDFKSANFG